MGPHPLLVNPAAGRIHGIFTFQLDVQSNHVALPRNDHAGAVLRVYRGLVPDIRKVRLRDHIDWHGF